MLSAVAWATAPPPAHHVAQGALPRLPSPPPPTLPPPWGRQLPAPGLAGPRARLPAQNRRPIPATHPHPRLTMPAAPLALFVPVGILPAPPPTPSAALHPPSRAAL